MFINRPVCSKEWLLELCASIANQPELQHLYDKDYLEENECLKVIDIGDLDMDDNYPDAYGLPDMFRVLFPSTYLKLKLIWQNLIELNGKHQFNSLPGSLIEAIDNVPLAGLIFHFTFNKHETERWEERTKFFHDIIDDTEARIAAMHPDKPMKLKRFPFAFGDWMQVVQSEDGTKSVLVATGGRLGGDMGTWVEFIMVKPDPATPDQPYPFNESEDYSRNQRVGVEYTWLSGPVLADWFASDVIANDDAVQMMDWYVENGTFKSGSLSETMAQIRARFDQEHPYDDDDN
jgi:hypothetical protein